MIFNVTGGGGSNLNFKVVGGTSQPSSPSENTIWVNTDTEITGWVFSVTEPESPSEGMVWILTGLASTAGAFNAIKKNILQVYPVSAKQYIDGAWTSKTSNIFANDTWNLIDQMKEYLVENGVIDMTAHPHTATDSRTATNSVTYSGKPSLRLQGNNGSSVTHTFANVTVPDWAKTMYIQYYRMVNYEGTSKFNIIGATVTAPTNGNYVSDNKTVSINVASLAGSTGTFKVTIYCYASGYYCYIGNVWFE